MEKYFARDALLPQGWAKDVSISVEDGDIVEVAPASPAGETLAGPVLPGMANLHSHAFQRGMAGLAEVRGEPQDDFWTWRELMYRFVERVAPEQAQAIALQLYIEMLKQGYTGVAEFNYLNHPAEMLERHLDAARSSGIAITLLPSLYRWSGFGNRPLQARQKRFDSDVQQVLRILDASRPWVSPDVRLGVAPHSLRAVDPASLRELVAAVPADAPIHIHAAEQRLLEYVQRRAARKRNLAVSRLSSSVGTTLWLEAAAGGAQALGRKMGAIARGRRADLVVLDAEAPDMAARSGDAIANALIFSGSSGLVRDVMVGGRWVVRDTRHAAEDAAAEA